MPKGDAGGAPRTVILVAVGAMMVGSIVWSVKEGDSTAKGDEQGYFQCSWARPRH